MICLFASTVSFRANKGRLSLPNATEGISDLLVFGKMTSAKTIVHPRSASMRKMQTIHEDQVDEAKTKHSTASSDDSDGESPSRQENKPKPISLEEKLADDQELGAIGILNLGEMNLTDKDVPLIVERVISEKKCIGLILRDNDLTSCGVQTLVDEFLSVKSKLKFLSLSNNLRVGDSGIAHVARFLKANRSLTFLSIPHTGMTDRGVQILADILCDSEDEPSNTSLEKLHISFNKAITDESLPILIDIIQKNHTLKLLYIQNCSLSEAARRRLRKVALKKKSRKFHLID